MKIRELNQTIVSIVTRMGGATEGGVEPSRKFLTDKATSLVIFPEQTN